MIWWTATSVSINNNSKTLVVNAGDDIGIISDGDALVLAGQIMQIDRAYYDGNNQPRVLLKDNWTAGNQTNQPAKALPLPADLRNAVKYLRDVGQDAITFSEAMAQILNSTAATLIIPTATSGDVTVVPYGRLVQQVNDLLATMGTFGVPLYGTNSKNHARTLMGLQPQVTAQPTLDLDFANNEYRVYEPFGLTRKTLTEAITTARASSANYNSPFGIANAAANVPRIEYDPTSGECLGLLCEEQRTNLLLWSEDFSNAAWLKSAVTVQNESDGFYKIIATTESTGHFIRQSSQDSVVAGTTYTLWVDVKAAEYNIVNLQMRDAGFTANQAASFRLSDQHINTWFFGTNNMSASIINLGGGVFRCILSGTASITVSAASIFWVRLSDNHSVPHVSFAGDGTSGILVRRAQLEAGPVPTSYIKTEGSQVTRAFDAHGRSLTALGDFTLYCEVKISTLSNNRFLWLSQNNTSSDRIVLACTSANNQLIAFYGVNAVFTNIQSSNNFLNTNSYFKLAVRRVGLTLSLFANGQLIGTNSSAANYSSGLNSIAIGREGSGGNPIGSSFKNLKIYRNALSDQQLIDLTRL